MVQGSNGTIDNSDQVHGRYFWIALRDSNTRFEVPFKSTITTAGLVNQGVVVSGSGNGNTGVAPRSPHNNNPQIHQLGGQRGHQGQQGYSNRGQPYYRRLHHHDRDPYDRNSGNTVEPHHSIAGPVVCNNNQQQPGAAKQSSGPGSSKVTNNNGVSGTHRWVPPSRRGNVEQQQDRQSYGGQPSRHPKYSYPSAQSNNSARLRALEENRNNAFKRIRGILNKLTPEKFDKLINEILSVDLSSTDILKGVIILIFEKALYEPKYSSMYAQLCKRLDEKSPVDSAKKITIFRYHLLNQCKEEFENRSKANLTFDHGYEPTEEELEMQFVAKRKMLGNIKFVGELGKLQIVQDRILHKCCEALVLGWKSKPLSEQAEDLECLCHLMKTCGKILDTPEGKYRMDQYFERMDQVIDSEKMPLRIRFMVQDVVEMRRNKWLPRRVGRDPERGPRPIQQVREDAARDGFIYLPQEEEPPKKITQASDLMHPFEEVFKKQQDDFFGSGFGGLSGGGPTTSTSSYLTGGYFGSGSMVGGYDDSDIGDEPSSSVSHSAKMSSPSPAPRSIREPQLEKPRFIDDEPDINDNDDKSLVMRRDSSQSGSGDAPSSASQANYPRERSYDSRSLNRRGGGHFHKVGYGEDKHAAPPDFGDRYSANRTRGRHYGGDYDNRGGRGGYHGGRGGSRYENNYRNNGQHGGGPRFHRSDVGFIGDPGHQNRFQERQEEPNLNSLPPRFNKRMPQTNHQQQFSHSPLSGSKDMELSLRPSAGSMLFKPKTPSLLPKSAMGRSEASTRGNHSPIIGQAPFAGKIMTQKEPTIVVKQGSLDKGKKEKKAAAVKGPTKTVVLEKVNSIVNEMVQKGDTTSALESWVDDDSIPSKFVIDAVGQLFLNMAKQESEGSKALIKTFIKKLVDANATNATQVQESFSKVLYIIDKELSKDTANEALVAENVADFAAWNIEEGFDTLKGVSDAICQVAPRCKALKGTFLKVLAILCGAYGNNKVKSLFDESNIKILDHVDENVKTDSQLAESLDGYDLSFLLPLLSIRQEMKNHLKSGGNAETLMSWIIDNVQADFHCQSEFIASVYSVVLNHIYENSTGKSGADKNAQPDKGSTELEKELMGTFKNVLRHFVAKKSSMQLTAVYALHVYCFEQDFPKGLLLRTFVNCYEMDILDEHAFLQWREDVNDKYPGKGKALFQVNSWLTWLEEAESEEEEDDDE